TPCRESHGGGAIRLNWSGFPTRYRTPRKGECQVKTILSVLRSPEDAERVLDQAIVLGRNFGSYLVGFHCEALPGAYAAPIGFPSAELFQANQEAESQRTDAIRAVFDRRLREAGLEGEFRFTASFSGDSAVSALS